MDNSAYARYCELRDKCGFKDSYVAEKSGVTKSTFSDWKAGRYIPKRDKMEKIARVLNVSVDYLMNGKTDDEPAYYLNEETAQAAQEIFQNKELRALFDVQRYMEPEDLRALHNMALALKRKESGSDDTGC